MRARVLKANWLYRWYSRPTLQQADRQAAKHGRERRGMRGETVVVRGEAGEHAYSCRRRPGL
jgi:hypothetical protein